MDIVECVYQVATHLSMESFSHLVLGEFFLALLDLPDQLVYQQIIQKRVTGHVFFYIVRDLVTIDPMAITDCKEVKGFYVIKVWAEDKCILVLLVGVSWDVANCGSKGKLCDRVVSVGIRISSR